MREWTKQEDNFLWNRCESAVSISRLASHLGRSEKSVRNRLHRLGIQRRQGTYSLRDMAAIIGCERRTVARWRDRLGLKFCKTTGSRGSDADLMAICRAMLASSDPREIPGVSAKTLRSILGED